MSRLACRLFVRLTADKFSRSQTQFLSASLSLRVPLGGAEGGLTGSGVSDLTRAYHLSAGGCLKGISCGMWKGRRVASCCVNVIGIRQGTNSG
ncbi:unnamed protein product [Protopolystoma xenopodis]|uniref:Uncharacterized protein n=1 Tax=Protopolystoma xenopodis TaxID=117903 RepID=A0A3S5CQ96_9PLAT|nr:unnamed protein product [Protopolystoma xenopodis]